MADHITHDSIYDTVDRDDFGAMLDVNRYNARSTAFDQIISLTRDHHWDPNDPAYVDFDAVPFDMKNDTIMPRDFTVELQFSQAAAPAAINRADAWHPPKDALVGTQAP